LARGLLIEEAEGLLRTSVQLALEARDEFWKSTLRKSKPVYNRALVAASVGSYGAYLADGSEYRYAGGALQMISETCFRISTITVLNVVAVEPMETTSR
jgi:S-methylmethionine-dependent homocysteine/selenocysteine methylase